MGWPQYHRDGGDLEGSAQRRHATSLHRLIVDAWHQSYARQRTELRKRHAPPKATVGISGNKNGILIAENVRVHHHPDNDQSHPAVQAIVAAALVRFRAMAIAGELGDG